MRAEPLIGVLENVYGILSVKEKADIPSHIV